MPNIHAISQRLALVGKQSDRPLVQAVLAQLVTQQYKGVLENSFVSVLCQQYQCTKVELALACLPLAACYALVPVSQFYVGAVAIGQSGAFYFGANQEFAHIAIAQTVHAEQSAIAHAWLAGESRLSDIVVNYTPCGHCRQFMNELNSATQLRIHLPHCQYQMLHHYLPDAFGPKDLGIEKGLFDPQSQPFELRGDSLTQAAIFAASQAYAPYSKAFSGIALQCGEQIIIGRYAENAAFNPSFLPLQSALNFRRLNGLEHLPVSRIVLVEKSSVISHRESSEALAKSLLGVMLEYVYL